MVGGGGQAQLHFLACWEGEGCLSDFGPHIFCLGGWKKKIKESNPYQKISLGYSSMEDIISTKRVSNMRLVEAGVSTVTSTLPVLV